MIIINLVDANDFVQRVTLDGTIYYLHMSWSGEDWTMDVRNADNVDIIRGISVRANFPLLAPYGRHLPTLRGQLLAVVNDGNDELCRDCFVNGRAKLVYVPASEVREILNNG